MIKADPPRVLNRRILHHLCAQEPSLLAVRDRLRACQVAYVAGDRDPRRLTALGLADPVAKLLRDLYGAERVRDQLAWIPKLREHHNHDCCPMCGGTGVSELDHVLPKANYPEFAIFSLNLVPTCSNCNRRRSNKGGKFHLVHPYFDATLLDRLALTITFRKPYDAIRFRLEVTGLHGRDLERVQDQIRHTLPLEVFRRSALRQWRQWHRRVHKHRSPARALTHVHEELDIAQDSARNSWETAFLRGLSVDAVARQWMADTPPDCANVA